MQRVALVLAALLVGAAWPSVAAGQDPPPACPVAPDAIVPPDPLTDNDRLVRELREGRREAAASCAAVVDRLDALGASSGSTRVAVEALHELGSGSAGLAVHETGEAPPPATSTVSLSDEDLEWFGATLTAARGDVWFIAGLLGALLFGYVLIRRDAG